jgi:hypothetical protein
VLSEGFVEVGRIVEVGLVSMHVHRGHARPSPMVWP